MKKCNITHLSVNLNDKNLTEKNFYGILNYKVKKERKKKYALKIKNCS
jgi:hypothetical protein